MILKSCFSCFCPFSKKLTRKQAIDARIFFKICCMTYRKIKRRGSAGNTCKDKNKTEKSPCILLISFGFPVCNSRHYQAGIKYTKTSNLCGLIISPPRLQRGASWFSIFNADYKITLLQTIN